MAPIARHVADALALRSLRHISSAAPRHLSKVSGAPRSHLATLDNPSSVGFADTFPRKGEGSARPQFVLANADIVGADHGPNRPIVNRAASTEGSPTALACIASIRARHARAAMSIAP